MLPRLAGALRQWSLQPHHADARRQALRALHTLKGSARLAGALHLGDLAHQLESTIEPIDVEEATSAEVEPLLGRYDALVREFERLCHRPTDQPSPLAAELAATETPVLCLIRPTGVVALDARK